MKVGAYDQPDTGSQRGLDCALPFVSLYVSTKRDKGDGGRTRSTSNWLSQNHALSSSGSIDVPSGKGMTNGVCLDGSWTRSFPAQPTTPATLAFEPVGILNSHGGRRPFFFRQEDENLGRPDDVASVFNRVSNLKSE